MNIIEEAKRVFNIEIESLINVMNTIDDELERLVYLINESKERVILTGMGKSGHVARKIAATLSSLGTPAYFLHPAECLHGDLGSMKKDDILIAFSKSGETSEILGLIPSVKFMGITLVSVTCSTRSTLSEHSSLNIVLNIKSEASAYTLAPTSSTTAMLVFGDALAVVLEKLNDFKPEQFAVYHPSGTLGKKLLLTVEMVMKKGDENAIIFEHSTLSDAISCVTENGLGCVTIVNENNEIIGLLTDGDIRRALKDITDIKDLKSNVSNYMTKKPFTINSREKLEAALQLMETSERMLNVLPVVNDYNQAVGTVRIHDIIRTNIF